MTTLTVSPDSLIGLALEDALADALALSYDEDGYQDTLEADHQHDQHGRLEEAVLEACDVLSVFAEESLRWS